MRVLVGFEFSGRVRDAFAALGHDAVSCDLLPSERPGPHLQCDVRDLDLGVYDLAIFHPPCTRLTLAGVRWLYKDGRGMEIDPAKWAEMEADARLFRWCLDAPVPRVAVENPKQHRHCAAIIGRPADQSIHPWQHGAGETKETRLWLRGLPRIVPSTVVDGRAPRVHHESPGTDRWRKRSRTYEGIASAMAVQWGGQYEMSPLPESKEQ